MSERLLIWRHGRTEWNATRRIQGQADVELDEVGRAQAQQSAYLLAAEKPDYVVSSDLRRARDTAVVLTDLLNLPLQIDERFRERHFGPWQGLTATEVVAEYPEEYYVWKRGGQPDVPGIETEEVLTKRMLAGVTEATAATDGTVCVVTHGGAARRMILGLLDWPPELVWRLEALGNCRWATLLNTSRGWRLHDYNVGPLAGAAGIHVPNTALDAGP
jgi:glucosyl-3-phosphoglycerate phosphatase